MWKGLSTILSNYFYNEHILTCNKTTIFYTNINENVSYQVPKTLHKFLQVTSMTPQEAGEAVTRFVQSTGSLAPETACN